MMDDYYMLYAGNRQRLADNLPDDSLVLIASGKELYRNRDVDYPFRASSDFWYLSGFEEPDSVLLLEKIDGVLRTHLVLRPKDPLQETWQGRRLGVEVACETLGVDQAYSIDALHATVLALLEHKSRLYFSFSEFSDWAPQIEKWLVESKAKHRQGIESVSELHDLDGLLHEQRLVKSEAEIALMKKAAQISVQGHLAAMAAASQSEFEYQIQAELESACRRLGASRQSFNTIAAVGENACVLHYTENSARLNRNELILVDAGAEYQGYAGDITSTFPVGGRFSHEQAQLYSLVLKAQQAAIAAVQPGAAYIAPHEAAVKVLTQGLLSLGILNGDLDALIAEDAYKPFYMHGTGHWLGMDVHDVGHYKLDGEWRPLIPGMVLTIEPGLYISETQTGVDEKWRGIGIRIEDDVLVTESGHEVLTTGLPRSVQEIEAWMLSHMAKS
ncbi:aminopeptidase P N-terminal domain-containing protein [Thiomicrorhabdus sp.]|uniref:aminopeptidase P N-terminal domain-containing protein n=1 Tax=Thiomicrorhabdus sp. TaxID=2039724 RepID=UPI0029C72210|nr:aminopeptidase P N-terminal domain-containing protein [Thiomicrorhabdus sp.]